MRSRLRADHFRDDRSVARPLRFLSSREARQVARFLGTFVQYVAGKVVIYFLHIWCIWQGIGAIKKYGIWEVDGRKGRRGVILNTPIVRWKRSSRAPF